MSDVLERFKQRMQDYQDKLEAEFPYVVLVTRSANSGYIDPSHHANEQLERWCAVNCKARFRVMPSDIDWRTASVTVPVRFASDHDATLFKMFNQ